MYVLAPIDVTDSVLTSSNLAEADYAAWTSGTAYTAGQRVMVTTTTLAKTTGQAWTVGQRLYWSTTSGAATTTPLAGAFIGHASATATSGATTGTVAVHRIYEATGSSTGVNPVSNVLLAAGDVNRKWVKVGATNKWKGFDQTISDPATNASDITYELTVPSLTTGVALFGLSASSVTVTVTDLLASVIYSETRSLVSTEDIVDWYTFVTWDPDYDTEALFTGLPGYAGHAVDITVAGTNVEVGEIVAGKAIGLGTTGAGTEVGFEDYSGKTRDDFGNAILLEREYSDWASFRFFVALSDARRVKRVVSDLRATPAVWFAAESLIDRGATVYGFPAGGLRLPLDVAGGHIASLEIEGLT